MKWRFKILCVMFVFTYISLPIQAAAEERKKLYITENDLYQYFLYPHHSGKGYVGREAGVVTASLCTIGKNGEGELSPQYIAAKCSIKQIDIGGNVRKNPKKGTAAEIILTAVCGAE